MPEIKAVNIDESFHFRHFSSLRALGTLRGVGYDE